MSRSRQPGVRGQALVEVADLLAQVFLLQLQQRFGVAAFHAGNEQRHETLEQVGDTAKHVCPPGDLHTHLARMAKNNGGRPYE